MDEKKIIKKIQYLWFLCGIVYTLSLILILHWINTYFIKQLSGGFEYYNMLAFPMTVAFILPPVCSYIGFIVFSFVIVFLLKKQKNKDLLYCKIFALLSLLLFGGGSLFIIIFSNRDSIGLGIKLFLIFNAIIVLLNIIIIYFSVKPEINELTA